MKKVLLLIAVALSAGQLSAQTSWRKASEAETARHEKVRPGTYSERQQLFTANLSAMRQAVATAHDKFSGMPGVIVSFPNINGDMERYEVWENSNFTPELQAQYPDIRAYVGHSLADKSSTINFSISPAGIQTMVLRPDNSSEFIEPYTTDRTSYVLFDSKTRTRGSLPFVCSTRDVALNQDLVDTADLTHRSSAQSYKTMRLALSCTGEYGQYFGGTVAGALAAMNATMTRVNGVMEKDLAIHLNLIPNENVIIYTNASTDPYSNSANMDNWNSELQANLNSVIGAANYDIGHLFGATGGGGNAGCIGCVCVDSSKGSGITSPADGIPMGDNFDIDYVIHEMGHQLGGNHSFSYNSEGSGVNVEPGSGSTIMGYAGITGSTTDVQPHSDPYFTYRNILQIQTNMASKTCPVSTAIVNTPPTVNAGADITIPKGTPFILKGVVTDAEGDALTYCWEQDNSAAGASSTGNNSVCYPTKTVGPNFRSFNPTTSPNRYMPSYASVLTGVLSTTWESVNTNARTSKYSLTVRDNNPSGQQTNTDEVVVTTSGTVGPFMITYPIATSVAWVAGENRTVTWDVNSSNTLAGAANVNIKLSLDNGVTFPYTLAENTPNDGSESIVVPNASASQTCRVMIEPTGSIFYTISPAPFLLGYEIVTSCNTYQYTGGAFTIPDGGSGYTVKTINVPATGTISDINISMDITHPNISNLMLAFIRPNGGTLQQLFSGQCSGSANLNVTFDAQGAPFTCGSPTQGTYVPPTTINMNSQNGANPTGNWSFGFRDSVAGGTGTVNGFSIEVCTSSLQLATQKFELEDFSLFPNPNNGNFSVKFNSHSNKAINIAVYDISGRSIYGKSFNNNGMFSQELQLAGAQAGVYIVSISDGDAELTKRIVVQ